MKNVILYTRQHKSLGPSESWQNCWYTVTEVQFVPTRQSSTLHGTSYWPTVSHITMNSVATTKSNWAKSNNCPHFTLQKVRITAFIPHLTELQCFCFPSTALFWYTALLRMSTNPKRLAKLITMIIRVNSTIEGLQENIGKFAGEVLNRG